MPFIPINQINMLKIKCVAKVSLEENKVLVILYQNSFSGTALALYIFTGR